MILTLVTQIKLDVTFSYDYKVVSLTVYNHVIDTLVVAIVVGLISFLLEKETAAIALFEYMHIAIELCLLWIYYLVTHKSGMEV